MAEQTPRVTLPANKPWWRTHRSFHAPGPGGKPLLWTQGLHLLAPDRDAPLLQSLNLSLRSTCTTAVLDRIPARSRALLLALAGLAEPAKGRIGTSAAARASHGRTAGVALISAQAAPDPSLTVRQNLVGALAPAGTVVDEAEFTHVTARCRLTGELDWAPADLGPEGRIRILAACALLSGAKVLLVEDPTAHLLPSHAEIALDFLTHLAEAGPAIVLSTTDATVAARADRAVLIAEGRLAADVAHPNLETLNELLELHQDSPATLLGPIPSATSSEGGPGLVDQDPPEDSDPPAETAQARLVDEGEELVPVAPRPEPEPDTESARAVTQEAVERVGHVAAAHARREADEDDLREELAPDTIESALARLAARNPIPENPDTVVDRARRILEDLPGPVFDKE